jgi:U4/U6 small nuclear ribonucleoprotein PRP31
VLGAKRRHTAGFSSSAAGAHQGFVFGCDVVQGTPPGLRQKAARLVGGKCTLLARVDAYGEDPSGVQGAAMKVRGGGSFCLLRHIPILLYLTPRAF